MSQLKRIDRIIEEVQSQVQGDVSALLGSPLTFSAPVSNIVSKEECFADLVGVQVIAHIDIDGDVNGVGGLLLNKKDAILLGGTLIMLPDAELDEVVSEENYTEDIADSYGEIANIVVGACSKVFEESYPKNCRFIRKTVESFKPAKIDPDGDELLPNVTYYKAHFTLSLDGKELGEMSFVFPAAPFGLDDSAPQDAAVETPVAEAPVEPVPEPEAAQAPEPQSDPVVPTAPVEEKPPVAASPAQPKDNTNQLKRIDRIIEEVQSQVQGDVSALLGSPLAFSAPTSRIVGKGGCFGDLMGSQIIAHIDIDGDINGVGGLLLNKKDAILLGGTLIMLPDAELDEVVMEENYTDDIADSYGEIANIVVGACSKVFEESFPKNCRFIRKTVEGFKPAKVDPDSDEILPNVSYYQAYFTITLGDKELGQMSFVFPAEPLGLGGSEQVAEVENVPVEDAKVAAPEAQAPPVPEPQSNVAPADPAAAKPAVDPVKNLERIDKVLAACYASMGDELGMLLGVEAEVSNMEIKLTSKEDFLAELMGKHVLSHLSVHGEEQQKAYLCVSLSNAIHLGGVLIMLPPSELEVVVQEQEFDEDAKDAFGEIANIIAGVYTAQFGDNHQSKARFIREEVEAFTPAKIDVDSDELLVNQLYYVHSMDVGIGGKVLGRLQLLLSAVDFGLVAPDPVEAGADDVSPLSEAVQSPVQPQATGSVPPQGTAPQAQAPANHAFDILLVSNNQKEAAKISAIAESKGFVVGCVGFGENVQRYISPNLKAICLVMSEVNEQSFGLAIKLSSGASSPLIAVGPGWTRSSVIKAVKYGVKDIILAPADSADIESCLSNNIYV